MLQLSAITIKDGWELKVAITKFSMAAESFAFKPDNPFDFVYRCLAYSMLNDNKMIGCIHLVSHGSKKSFNLGSHSIDDKNVDNYAGHFAKLRQLLTGQSFVYIRGCEVGCNQELLKKMAAAFAVPVYAGEGFENILWDTNTDDIKVASPGGTVSSSKRPERPVDPYDPAPKNYGSYQSS